MTKLQGDLASSAEFVPGYSSFLFNQLLQSQFYTVSNGGLSININLADRNYSNTASNNNNNNNASVIAEPHVITSSPTLSSTLAHNTTSTTHNNPQNVNRNNAQPVQNVNMIYEVHNNIENNNRYKSEVFQQVLSKQKDHDNTYFDNETRVHIPIYPELDLVAFFGEEELMYINKRRLQTLLYDSYCNIDILKLYSRKYVPTDMRPMVWQLLLGYLPLEKSQRETVLLSKQKLYNEKSNYAATVKNEELLTQIDMDVLRTLPEGHEKLFGNAAVKQSLSRVLLVWALDHPATGYFQGLNDLASPFFYSFLSFHSTYQIGKPAFFDDVMNDGEDQEWGNMEMSQPDLETGIVPGLLRRVEADAYWCLCAVLDSVEHLNAFSKCGVHGEIMMTQLETLVKKIDVPLDTHMKNENLEYIMFSFPWMLCLFVREATLDNLLILWDFYCSHEKGVKFAFSVMHVYVCAAFLIRFRDDIMSLEFPEMLKFLHRPPTKHWTPKDMYALIDNATLLYNTYPMSL